MTTQTSIPKTLGLMINVLLLFGFVALVIGVYLAKGLALALVVGGVILILLALYITRLFYYWSMQRVQNSISSDRR